MFDRQLAKWHLEKQGYLAAIDVNLGEIGTADVFGVKMGRSGLAGSVFGAVRGWWHSGAYLTPSLIRNHLQTDRGLLDRTFASERLASAAAHYGLAEMPEKVLFFSMRSPSLADDAEHELAKMSIKVVYLEDILARALAEVQDDVLGQSSVFQVLAMVKGSHVFKEMARLARLAEKHEEKPSEETGTKTMKKNVQQLELLGLILAQEDKGDSPA